MPTADAVRVAMPAEDAHAAQVDRQADAAQYDDFVRVVYQVRVVVFADTGELF